MIAIHFTCLGVHHSWLERFLMQRQTILFDSLGMQASMCSFWYLPRLLVMADSSAARRVFEAGWEAVPQSAFLP